VARTPDDSLNLYDVSFLAHYELFKAIKQAGQAQKSELPDLAVGQRDLLGGMRSQLRAGVARQSKDPFGLSNPYGLQDTVPHALGYALAGELYGEIVGTSPYEPFASNQRDWVLGANAWGSSFVVGRARPTRAAWPTRSRTWQARSTADRRCCGAPP
jgi:hypothetical protein